MRDVAWRIAFTLTILAALAVLGPNVSCNLTQYLAERALGRTPQDQIASYLAAVARGERQIALDLWPAAAAPNATLQARREAVTDDLLAYGPRMAHRVLDVVWWRTCCEPAAIDDPREAGGARIWVAIRGEGRPEKVYLFDLLVPGGYSGAAAGHPVRDWTIVDVYPESEAPLAWTVGL